MCGQSGRRGEQRKCCRANHPRKLLAHRVGRGHRLCLPRHRGTRTVAEVAVSALASREFRKKREKTRRLARLEGASIASDQNLSSPCGKFALEDRVNFSSRILTRASRSAVFLDGKVFQKMGGVFLDWLGPRKSNQW